MNELFSEDRRPSETVLPEGGRTARSLSLSLVFFLFDEFCLVARASIARSLRSADEHDSISNDAPPHPSPLTATAAAAAAAAAAATTRAGRACDSARPTAVVRPAHRPRDVRISIVPRGEEEKRRRPRASRRRGRCAAMAKGEATLYSCYAPRRLRLYLPSGRRGDALESGRGGRYAVVGEGEADPYAPCHDHR